MYDFSPVVDRYIYAPTNHTPFLNITASNVTLNVTVRVPEGQSNRHRAVLSSFSTVTYTLTLLLSTCNYKGSTCVALNLAVQGYSRSYLNVLMDFPYSVLLVVYCITCPNYITLFSQELKT